MNLSNIRRRARHRGATVGLAAHADEHRKAAKDHRHVASGIQAVAVSPKAGTTGPWLAGNFSGPRKPAPSHHQPAADYYYSRGDCLQLEYESAPRA
ncbi:MAG: hypothetical protein IPG77_14210 [Betaproteobacteria bacterium]|nr:hypothetical protein [Betaproteobacteria bacterium]